MYTGHYQLWNNSICHRDISEGNLMAYYVGKEDDPEITVHGVLIDFDLAIEKGNNNKHAKERTGTWPFMAIDLLLDTSGSSEHRYGEVSFFRIGALG
jgi:serine/threonine protein kinase